MLQRAHHYFHRLHEAAHERMLGISTSEWHTLLDDARPDFRGYGPTTYRDWNIIRRHIKIGGTFIDYGAGLGRVAILAGRLPFSRVIGVEFDEGLAARATENVDLAKPRLACDVEIVCQDAREFLPPHDTSTMFFCNPFTGGILSSVLSRAKELPALVQIVCNLPDRSAFENEIAREDWLHLRKLVRLTDGRKLFVFTPIG